MVRGFVNCSAVCMSDVSFGDVCGILGRVRERCCVLHASSLEHSRSVAVSAVCMYHVLLVCQLMDI